MAIIKKKIENLKPGKNYIISVRTKNPDLNVFSESSNSILYLTMNMNYMTMEQEQELQFQKVLIQQMFLQFL